jgi:hypothetical protein
MWEWIKKNKWKTGGIGLGILAVAAAYPAYKYFVKCESDCGNKSDSTQQN